MDTETEASLRSLDMYTTPRMWHTSSDLMENRSSIGNQTWLSDPGGNATLIDSYFFYEVMLNDVNTASQKIGLNMNKDKTKIMNNANESQIMTIYGHVIDRFIQFPVMWFLFITIVVGNTCVIVALLLAKSRKSRMNYFIMHLAIADLCVGLVSVFTDIVHKMTIAWLAGNMGCKIIRFLQAVVTYSSTYVLVALSIDRCDAITHPMNFSGSWKRAKVLVAAAWLLSALLSTPILVLYEEKIVQDKVQCWIDLGSERNWKIWMTSVTIALFVIPALTITGCYTVIVITIWAKNKVVISPPSSKRTRQGEDVDTRRASSRGLIPRAKIKTIKMTFVIVFVFIVCWSPYIVFDMLQVYKCIPTTQEYLAVATLVQSLAPLNSAANPLIYCIFSTHIFNSLRRIPILKWLCCGGGRRGRHHTSESTTMSDMLTSSQRNNRRNTILHMHQRHDSNTRMHLINNGSHHPTSIVRQTSDTSSGKRVQVTLPSQ